MAIEILGLTDRGRALSKSTRRSPDKAWDVLYFISRMGGQTTKDKIATFVFGGDEVQANRTIGYLRSKGCVV
jgi:hypothetical protein